MVLPKCLLPPFLATCLWQVAEATPLRNGFGFESSQYDNSSSPFVDYPDVIKSRADKVELRILSLGASIMQGWGSTHESGLRKPLRMALRHDGYNVNMVGTRQHGTDFKDNDHEATAGHLIHMSSKDLERSLPYRPNLVIINVGTNNANQNRDVSNAYNLMRELVDKIWNESGMQDACVILSTIIPTSDSTGTINRIAINQQYRNLVTDKAKDGNCIYLADMEPPGEGSGFLGLNQPIWNAGENPKIHPNDEGHRRMAYVFYAAIHRALAAGKVPKAADMELGTSNCDKIPGNGEFVADTQKGSGQGNGVYYHFSEEQGGPGPIFTVESPWDRNQWRFGRLFNRKFDDLLGWYEYAPNDHRFGVYANSADGKGKFTRFGESQGDLRGMIYCIPRGLHFVDVDGDGLDDIVCVSPDGDLHMSHNRGDGDRASGKLPTFDYMGQIMAGKAKQDRVRLADIDGDGRVDYGVIRDNGHVEFWRNSGVGDKPGFWQHLGVRVTMQPLGQANNRNEGIRFEDINGDGRDDWMWMNTYGETTTYTNTRSCTKGREGDGLNVAWRQAFFRGQNSGPTHGGVQKYRDDHDDDDFEDWRPRIHFARIYGNEESFQFKNQAKKDYVFLERFKGDEKEFKFNMRVWKNLGSGGTKLEADGNKYCNMHGHSDGREDYVWVLSTGAMDLYPNRGIKHPGKESYWAPWAPGFWKPPGGIEINRNNLHLADFNGDGACDIIWADPARNHRVRVWINNYPKTKNWANAWSEMSNPPNLECNDRDGIGFNDVAVRLHDITGNGRADWLCVREDGLVRGRLQDDKGSFGGAMQQMKFPEGKERANLRWADVNGDGRADMIWVDKFNGNGFVWYSDGPHNNPSENSGSVWKWRKINDHVYDGSVAGSCQYFPDLDGNGRADLHSIKGTWTNTADSWYNRDCGLRDAQGDDAEGVVDPHLPEQPGNPIGGPGPIEGDCNRDNDDRDWRKVDCNSDLVKDHDQANPKYSLADIWRGIDATGAYRSTLDYWQCQLSNGRPAKSFPDLVSDFFHGPPGFNCEKFTDANGCAGGSNLQCPSTTRPAGYWILNSFKKIYTINKSWYEAVGDVVNFNDPEQLAKDFGLSDKDKSVSIQVMTDIMVMAWSILMGPTWNKLLQQSSRPSLGGGNAGTVKDEINDFVKNAATLAKDIYTMKYKAVNERGLEVKIRSAMKDIGLSWRETIESSTKMIFDGSDDSAGKLSVLMADGAMLDNNLLDDLEAGTMYTNLKRIMNGQLIPQTWYLSHEKIYPVIIREDIGCNDHPAIDWSNDGVHYMDGNAYSKRLCGDFTGGKSYWLVGPKDFDTNCDKGGSTGDPDPNCKAFAVPPGFEELEKDKWSINLRDVVEGSINTWIAAGRKNGASIPEINTQTVDQMIEKGVKAPGFFRIPICDMLEARDNWYKAARGAKPWVNFPCNE